MKKKFKPPTLEEIEGYVREKALIVEPQFFWDFFEAGDPPWHDTNGKLVKSWKQKMLTWNRMQLERGGSHPCSHTWCKKPGVYIHGKDRDGHPFFYCLDHKPKPKPLLPEVAKIADKVLKKPDYNFTNFHDKRNMERKALDYKESAEDILATIKKDNG